MSYSIAFFCPDHHIVSNWNEMNNVGVGGGITARLRIAHALADIGNQVTLYVNCPRDEEIQGVQYIHYSHPGKVTADALILSSSGGELDLGGWRNSKISTGIKILLIAGAEQPKGIDINDLDYIYAPSNFIRGIVERQWTISRKQLFVQYHGIPEENYTAKHIYRDDHALVFLSHPSKGLSAARSLLQQLRNSDVRYLLHVYGGSRLWGEEDTSFLLDPGVVDHGMVGQKDLACALMGMSFSIHLQTRQEPFGLSVIESMRAGCIVIASPVGAYPEIITHGFNGFLIPGDPEDPLVCQTAADWIRNISRNKDYADYIRSNAVRSVQTWHQVARTWVGHWDWHFHQDPIRHSTINGRNGCKNCSGALIALADGLHCLTCGHYQRGIELG